LSILNVPRPDFMLDDEIRIFEDSVIRFLEENAPPERVSRWRAAGMVEREFWTLAGQQGLLGMSIPERYGGGGGDFRHDIVLIDQVVRREVNGFAVSLHNGIAAPYVMTHGTEEQKRLWLPSLADGKFVAAIAMSEPGVGSDLRKIRTTTVRKGDSYLINGQKTFITNGQLANFVIVAAKTDPGAGGRGISLLVVETDQSPGFRRGRKLKKIGNEAQDTSELFFDEVEVPVDNLLGGVEGRGFHQLMAELPRERLIIAVQAMASMERALEVTIAYVKEREVFGQRLLDFQNTQFKLAECKTQATIARVFLDHCIGQVLNGQLDTATASMAKYWMTDLQNSIIDTCLQLHGGYGYMEEYPIARMFKDARVSRIYGGTNEVMKLLIARTL
jgi:acyl-CoA dehydrogenase